MPTLRRSTKKSTGITKKKSRIPKRCLPYLSRKIGININEFKSKKRYSSKNQAIAVAYAQTNKNCVYSSKRSSTKKSSSKKRSSSTKKRSTKKRSTKKRSSSKK
jgi:hypothetical protein